MFTNVVNTVTTSAATLTVNVAPAVTTQPASTTVNAGATATFTAAASGTPTPTVQWQSSTNGTTWNDIGSATSASYSFTTAAGDNAKQYRAVFTNTVGTTTTSAATLTVNFAPSITTQPTSTTVNAGQTATFTAAATGNPTPTVQWQSSTNGTTWFDINGATSTTYSLTTAAGDNAKQYRAVFTNVVNTATTTSATLTVNTAPVVTTQPTSTTVVSGGSAVFEAAATGTPAPSVQWQVSGDGGVNWTDINSATSNKLEFTTADLDNGKKYHAVFTNAAGTTTSATASLTITPAGYNVTTNPTDQTVNSGTTVSFTAAATGKPNPLVQWLKSTDGGVNWANISGATSTTYSFTAGAADNGSIYEALFYAPGGGSATAMSTAATLTVNYAPSVLSNPFNDTVESGSTAEFTASCDANPTASVQWQVSTNGGSSWANISGATSTTYSFTAAKADNGKQYQAVFTNTLGTATSDNATLTVTYAPSITTEPSSTTVNSGGTVTLTAASDASPTASVQWQVSTDNCVTWSDIQGATNGTYSFTAAAADNGKCYQAIFTNTEGEAITTAAILTVNYAPSVLSNPFNDTVESGSTAEFTASCDANPTASVQWQVSTNGGSSWANISGATSTTYSFTAAKADNGKQYQAVFTNTLGTATSDNATLTVTYAPSITTEPSSTTVNSGGTVTLTAASDASPTASVQWQVSTDNCVTWSDIQGATNGTYSFTAAAADNGKCYQAIFTNSEGEAITTAALLTVKYAPSITTQPTSTAVVVSQTASFTAASDSNPGATVQWQVSSNGGTTWTNIGGATSTTYSFTPVYADSGKQYQAVFSNSVGSTATSAATLTVSKAGTTTTVSTSSAPVYGQTVSLAATVTASVQGLVPSSGTVQFVVDGVNLGSPVAVAGGMAVISTKTLSAGSHTVTAVYSGDSGTFQGSNSSASPVTLNVAKAVLTVTGSITATSRLYDGTTAATVKTSGLSLVGVIIGDIITLGSAAVTGTFTDKNVGTGKTVQTNGLTISGAAAGNYTLVQPTIMANITPRNITITLYANSKVYDGTTAVTLRLQDNRVPGDVLTDTYTSAAFSNKNVGTNKTVTIVGGGVTGPDAGNYNFTPFVSPITTNASITAKAIVGTVTVADKVFDNLASGTMTSRTLTGVLPGDVVNYVSNTGYEKATFSDKHVGVAKTVTATSLYLSGADAGNYTVNSVATSTATISPFALTVTATGNRRVYDGTTAATVTLACNSVPGSTVTLSYASASFADKNVGNNKPVTVTGIQLSGPEALDYTFNSTASTTANITQRTLVITATAANKKYDGTKAATVTSFLDNRVLGDDITLSYAAASFASAAVGTNITVTVGAISSTGADKGNYIIPGYVYTTANINA